MSRHQLIHVTAAMDDRIKPEIVIASFSPVGGRSALGFPLALAFACGWTMASPAACSAWTWPACARTPSPAGPQQHAGSVHVGGSSVACHRKGQVRKEKKRAPRRASFPESNRQQRLAIFRGRKCLCLTPCMLQQQQTKNSMVFGFLLSFSFTFQSTKALISWTWTTPGM